MQRELVPTTEELEQLLVQSVSSPEVYLENWRVSDLLRHMLMLREVHEAAKKISEPPGMPKWLVARTLKLRKAIRKVEGLE